MLFRQFVDDDLGCASYLIGDPETHDAVVVDPAYAIEQYVDEAERKGARICRVLETHTHADHVSGHGRFALEHEIPVSIHPAAEADFPYDPLADGQEIALGRVSIRVLHTPGHRPEHCCFAVIDTTRGDEPWLVLTGDSLFVGEAARPDLAVEAREGAEGLFHSLRRLLELPDGVEIYPGHVAGSLCGSGMSSKASTTIGFERRFNPALALNDVAAFVDDRMSAAALKPPNMDRIVELNRGPFLGRQPDLQPVRSRDGATVLDVRSPRAFAAGHVPGAINVAVSGSRFATKAGFVLTPDERVVLHGSSPEEVERAARGLRAIGFFAIDGFLDDPETPESVETLDLDELDQLLSAEAVELIDVREKDERSDGYIAGSRHIPYRLIRAFTDDVARDRPVVTICESGSRAAIGASILAAAGVDARPVLGAGVSAWQRRGNSTVEFRRCGA